MGTGPMRWSTSRGVQWASATLWLPTASAPRATQEIRTAVASTKTYPAVCPFEKPPFMCHLGNYNKHISVSSGFCLSFPNPACFRPHVTQRPPDFDGGKRQRDDSWSSNQRVWSVVASLRTHRSPKHDIEITFECREGKPAGSNSFLTHAKWK